MLPRLAAALPRGLKGMLVECTRPLGRAQQRKKHAPSWPGAEHGAPQQHAPTRLDSQRPISTRPPPSASCCAPSSPKGTHPDGQVLSSSTHPLGLTPSTQSARAQPPQPAAAHPAPQRARTQLASCCPSSGLTWKYVRFTPSSYGLLSSASALAAAMVWLRLASHAPCGQVGGSVASNAGNWPSMRARRHTLLKACALATPVYVS